MKITLNIARLLFMILMIIWIFLFGSVIYTVYFMTPYMQVPEDPTPIHSNFINLEYVIIMLFILFSNIILHTKTMSYLSNTRKIILVITVSLQTLFVVLLFHMKHDVLFGYSISHFSLYNSNFIVLPMWRHTLIVVILYALSLLNLLYKNK